VSTQRAARAKRTRTAVSADVGERAERLAAAGKHTDVIAYLGARAHELERTPGLALLYGRAHARVGHDQEGIRWIDHAITAARDQKLLAVEVRALNARGVAALVGGRLDEAAEYFTQALTRASSDSVTGRSGAAPITWASSATCAAGTPKLVPSGRPRGARRWAHAAARAVPHNLGAFRQQAWAWLTQIKRSPADLWRRHPLG
jgi:hypothetical protein